MVCATFSPVRAAEVDWSRARLVTLITVEYAFEPSHLRLQREAVYQLHIENYGRELHELTSPDFFKSIELRNPELLTPEHTEIVLHPGEQKDFYFVTHRSGHYDMWCADHDWAGMKGDIAVE
jgi:plastocyanin